MLTVCFEGQLRVGQGLFQFQLSFFSKCFLFVYLINKLVPIPISWFFTYWHKSKKSYQVLKWMSYSYFDFPLNQLKFWNSKAAKQSSATRAGVLRQMIFRTKPISRSRVAGPIPAPPPHHPCLLRIVSRITRARHKIPTRVSSVSVTGGHCHGSQPNTPALSVHSVVSPFEAQHRLDPQDWAEP